MIQYKEALKQLSADLDNSDFDIFDISYILALIYEKSKEQTIEDIRKERGEEENYCSNPSCLVKNCNGGCSK